MLPLSCWWLHDSREMVQGVSWFRNASKSEHSNVSSFVLDYKFNTFLKITFVFTKLWSCVMFICFKSFLFFPTLLIWLLILFIYVNVSIFHFWNHQCLLNNVFCVLCLAEKGNWFYIRETTWCKGYWRIFRSLLFYISFFIMWFCIGSMVRFYFMFGLRHWDVWLKTEKLRGKAVSGKRCVLYIVVQIQIVVEK